jgi:hypothetical protein
LNIIEENNENLNQENEELKKIIKELNLDLFYFKEKDQKFEENAQKLKNIQNEYEISIKEYKFKQEENRKKYENKEKDYFDEIQKQKKDYNKILTERKYEIDLIRNENDIVNIFLS